MNKNNKTKKYNKMRIMKKFGFLVGAVCIACSGLLTSCFSSGGEIPGSKIWYQGKQATWLNLDNVTRVEAYCDVEGLKGHAMVEPETSRELYTKNIDGLLIWLRKKIDDKLKPLKTPEDVLDPTYAFPKETNIIEAFCYPHEVTFSEPIELTVETVDAEGMSFLFYFMNKESDNMPVSTDADGLHTKIPHFSYWMFRMNIDEIKVLDTKIVKSEEMTSYCGLTSENEVKRAEYNVPWGYKSNIKNPFVTVFLNQWAGVKKKTGNVVDYIASSEKTFVHEFWCKDKPGTEHFHYEQPIYTLSLRSGTKEFTFELYGTPVSKHDSFASSDHNGGGGVNP